MSGPPRIPRGRHYGLAVFAGVMSAIAILIIIVSIV